MFHTIQQTLIRIQRATSPVYSSLHWRHQHQNPIHTNYYHQLHKSERKKTPKIHQRLPIIDWFQIVFKQSYVHSVLFPFFHTITYSSSSSRLSIDFNSSLSCFPCMYHCYLFACRYYLHFYTLFVYFGVIIIRFLLHYVTLGSLVPKFMKINVFLIWFHFSIVIFHIKYDVLILITFIINVVSKLKSYLVQLTPIFEVRLYWI